MANKSKNNIKLGALVLVGIVLLFGGLFYVGRQQNLFSDVFYLHAMFEDVRGLQEGNNVRYSGIDVGTINDIKIVSDSLVKVEFSVRKRIAEYIKEDSHAQIGTEGLMGSTILIIYPGSPKTASIEEYDAIPVNPSMDFDDLVEQLSTTTDQINMITGSINEITEKLNNGSGLLGKLLSDTVLAQKVDLMAEDVLQTTNRMNIVSRKINSGNGDIGRLLNDDQITDNLTQTMRKIDSIATEAEMLTEQLNMVAGQVRHGEGVVHTLLYDSTLSNEVQRTVSRLDETVAEIEAASEAVSNSWILGLFNGKDKDKKKKKKAD